jgi:hypothetical protein
VTIAYKGRVEHHDSSGGGGVIDEGDVQWMTAASGVLHKEFHESNWSKAGGEFQMVQLWVNLPARYKMSPPKYQGIYNNDIPKVPVDKGSGHVEVIAGVHKTTHGAAETFSDVRLLNAVMYEGDEVVFSTPAHYNTCLIVIDGEVTVNNQDAPAHHFVLFKNEGEEFVLRAKSQAKVLVLSGDPLHEPIAAHGPFVMNTHQELIQAFMDFNEGKFGYLAD